MRFFLKYLTQHPEHTLRVLARTTASKNNLTWTISGLMLMHAKMFDTRLET